MRIIATAALLTGCSASPVDLEPQGAPQDAATDGPGCDPRQGPAALWVKTIDGGEVLSVAMAGNGDLVVAGWMTGAVTLGEGEPSEVTLTVAPAESGSYLARFTADGALVWARALPSVDLLSVALAPNGRILGVGGLRGTATLGAGEPGETSLTSLDDGGDVLVTLYEAGGSLAWARRAGGPLGDQGSAGAVAADGSIRVGGFFDQEATFGPGEAGETTLASSVGRTSFVARYEADGTLAWAEGAGGNVQNQVNGLAVAADGGAVVAGVMSTGDVTFGDVTVSSSSYHEIFVARFDPGGSAVWARAESGDVETASGVAVAADGGIYVVGSLGFDDALFGAGEPGETSLAGGGWDDAQDPFLARYAEDGSFAWVRRPAVSAASNFALAVAITSDGGAVLTGGYQLTVRFDDGCDLVYGPQDHGMWLARYDASGARVWANALLPSPGTAFGVAVAASSDRVLVGGRIFAVHPEVPDGGGELGPPERSGFLVSYPLE